MSDRLDKQTERTMERLIISGRTHGDTGKHSTEDCNVCREILGEMRARIRTLLTEATQ